MEKIKILGSGCSKCTQTEHMVRQMLVEHNLDIPVEKVEDIQEIIRFNVLSTPAVVVDDRIRIYGHVPSYEELEAVILNK